LRPSSRRRRRSRSRRKSKKKRKTRPKQLRRSLPPRRLRRLPLTRRSPSLDTRTLTINSELPERKLSRTLPAKTATPFTFSNTIMPSKTGRTTGLATEMLENQLTHAKLLRVITF